MADAIRGETLPTYDFRRCKLCGQTSAVPTYRLKNTTVYACPACGFHYIDHLDELPGAAGNKGDRVLDRQAREYIERRLAASLGQQQAKLRLVNELLPLPGAHCLDLGAGAGLFASLLATAGATVQGIEPQQVFRDFARQKFGLAFRPETIEAPYWQETSAEAFDLVTLWDVLEHVNFPAETLRAACHVLKPGGWLLLDTPRRDAFFYRLSEWSYRCSHGSNPLLLESLYSPLPYRHKQIFTREQLHRLAEANGLRVERLESPWRTLRSQMTLVCRKALGTSSPLRHPRNQLNLLK